MGTRGVGARAAGEEMAAEPVPVRRPGVRVIGELGVAACCACSPAALTGNTKIGLNLMKEMSISGKNKQRQYTETPAKGFR